MNPQNLKSQRIALGSIWIVFGFLAFASLVSPSSFEVPKDIGVGVQPSAYKMWHQLGQIGYGAIRPLVATFDANVDRFASIVSVVVVIALLLCGALSIVGRKSAVLCGLLLSYAFLLGALISALWIVFLAFLVTVMQAHRVIWYWQRASSNSDAAT